MNTLIMQKLFKPRRFPMIVVEETTVAVDIDVRSLLNDVIDAFQVQLRSEIRSKALKKRVLISVFEPSS